MHTTPNLLKAQTITERLKDHTDSCLPAAHDPSAPLMQLRLTLCWSVTVARFFSEIQYGIVEMTEMMTFGNSIICNEDDFFSCYITLPDLKITEPRCLKHISY